jgi:hypothetical protein
MYCVHSLAAFKDMFLYPNEYSHARFEAVTAVVMNGSVFLDTMLCSPLKANLRTGQAGSQPEAGSERYGCLPHAGLLLGLFFNPENGGDMFLQNVT